DCSGTTMSIAFSPANPPSNAPPAPHTIGPKGGNGEHSALPAAPPAAPPARMPVESATALPQVCSPVAAPHSSVPTVSTLPAQGSLLNALLSRVAASGFLARLLGLAAARFCSFFGTNVLALSSWLSCFRYILSLPLLRETSFMTC